jgi:hypothetical protein
MSKGASLPLPGAPAKSPAGEKMAPLAKGVFQIDDAL